MILHFDGFHEHVINIHRHCFSELFEEHTVDESLISGASTLKTEQHYLVAVSVAVSNKCSFLLIIRVHHDLIIPEECVHEGHEFVPSCCFDQAIDVWQWEAIIWTCLIEIGEIDAHLPLSVFLFDNDWVSEPVRISHLCYGSDYEEFYYLVVNRTCAFGSQILFFCLTGLKVGSAFSSCHVTLMSIPSMSYAAHANVCKFFFRQAMSSVFTDSLRFAPISTQRSGYASSKHTQITGSQVSSFFASKALADRDCQKILVLSYSRALSTTDNFFFF